MKSLLELYGQQFRNPMLSSDSEDYTTADVFGQMGANKRRSEYDNSLLGMVHNWATGEARQPVQLPDNAPLMDQMKEAGMRMLNLPNEMAAGGAKTMAHWMGGAFNPEMVEPLDMLAPLGIGAMAGMAGRLRPSGFVGEKLSRDEASARALGRVGDQPAIADRDMLPFEPMYVPQAKRGPPLMGKNIPTVFDDYNGWGRIYANSAKFPDDADVLRSRGASPMREAMNDAQDVPIDAYDRAALDRQWRQKVARTGELFADQSRASLPGLLAGAADEPKGITAYHGSPHDFDRFSMDKIGTGEGAQAYGHGLYFADNEGVARSYRDNLSASNGAPDLLRKKQLANASPAELASLYVYERGGVERARYALQQELDQAVADKSSPDVAYPGRLLAMRTERKLSAAIAAIDGGKELPRAPIQGRMYEVRINADPEDFLDWDKPLSQQSEKARNALAGRFANDPVRSQDLQYEGGASTPSYILRNATDAETTKALREAGIPGIRYLDQGSRTAGDGSRNYVLFDDALVEILRKYGLLGMIGGGSLLGSSESEASPAGGGFGVP